MTSIFLLILLGLTLIQINKKLKNISFIIFTILLLSVFLYWGQIFQFVSQEFYYQLQASVYDLSTFSSTNKFYTLKDFFLNSYQMITNVSLIHFSESFFKASLLLFNSFITYMVTIFLSLIYFFKNLKLENLFYFKAIFLFLFFIINGFLSQNNPAGAIRYMSSAIPIYTTFIFAILPE